MKRLGADLRRARVRQSMPMADVAARCLLTLPTLRKMERDDPAVSLRAVASALWALGLHDRLGVFGRAAYRRPMNRIAPAFAAA